MAVEGQGFQKFQLVLINRTGRQNTTVQSIFDEFFPTGTLVCVHFETDRYYAKKKILLG